MSGFLQKELGALHNDVPNLRHLMPAKGSHIGDGYWIEPELCITSGVSDMDVGRLAYLHA